MRRRQIIAMGGGGFSMEPDNPLLDLYLLKQTRRACPRVCFIPTASGDADSYVVRFYTAFARLECRPSHLSLFRPPKEVAEHLLGQDAVYVGGGSTKNLVAVWRAWGLDRVLRTAWERGIVLAGVSAGSLCWFEQGLTDSTRTMTPMACLGFLRGSNCPHYSNEPRRRPAYTKCVGKGELADGIAADDGVALHYIGERLHRVVSSRPKARAYRVTRVGRRAKETRIIPVFLGRKARG